MTDYALGFPGKYIQGPGAIDRLGTIAAAYCKAPLVMADGFVRDLLEDRLSASLKAAGLNFSFETFGGECSRTEFCRIAEAGRTAGSDLVIAVGGGKALDAGKAAAAEMGVDVVSVPTIASTDAPASSVAVEYSDTHVIVGALRFPRAPIAVIVDSQIIAEAPPHLLAAGMGDALATWVEARTCRKAGRDNMHGGRIPDTAMVLAERCYDLILTHGREAMAAVRQHQVTDALEQVIEANVFLSGVGFQNTGVAGAHALDGAIGHFTDSHDSQHGERVGVGILMQLHLEGAEDEIAALSLFYKDVGLPRTLAAVDLPDMSDDDLDRLAGFVMRDGSPIRNMHIDVTRAEVAAALAKLR